MLDPFWLFLVSLLAGTANLIKIGEFLLKIKQGSTGLPTAQVKRSTLIIMAALTISVMLGAAMGLYALFAPGVTTSRNVESNIRKWLDSFHTSAGKVDDPQTHFHLSVQMSNGSRISVKRMKNLDGYVVLVAAMTFDQNIVEMISKLPTEQQTVLASEIRMELARLELTNFFAGFAAKPAVIVEKRLPIQSSLTEDSFITKLESVDFGLALIRHATLHFLNERGLKP